MVRVTRIALGSLAACGILAAITLHAEAQNVLDFSEAGKVPAVVSVTDDDLFVAQQPGTAAPSTAAAQPPTTRPTTPPRQPSQRATPPPNMLASRSSYSRLASVPDMMGDQFGSVGQITAVSRIPQRPGPLVQGFQADLPLAGGARAVKISENNKALPGDRAIFLYHHFHNALSAVPDVNTGVVRNYSVERFVVGAEKSFADGCWSIDVRMPLSNNFDPFDNIFAGDVGNLSIALKRLLYSDDDCAVSIGLAVGLPTGSDVEGFAFGQSFEVENEAVDLQPFLAFMHEPTDRVFWHTFLSVDTPVNGNEVHLGPAGQALPVIGELTEQTLLYVDISAGYWLCKSDDCDDDGSHLRGLAALFELHYGTTTNDADSIFSAGQTTSFIFGDSQLSARRFDILNATAGLNWRISPLADLRVAGVAPLRDDDDRQFDAEIQVGFNRRF